MIVLGINGFFEADHDAGAACIIDGKISAAVEEERLCRVKRALYHNPLLSVKEVLSLSNILAKDVDVIAYPWIPYLSQNSYKSVRTEIIEYYAKHNLNFRKDVQFVCIPHHEAHAWVGLAYTEIKKRTTSNIVVADGCGETTSGAVYRYENDQMKLQGYIPYDKSLGCFYEAGTRICGFHWGQEGKTMGLASYCPRTVIADSYSQIVGNIIDTLKFDLSDNLSSMGNHVSYETVLTNNISGLLHFLGFTPHTFVQKSVCAAICQEVVNNKIAEIVHCLPKDNLILSGGVALNCSTNSYVSKLLSKDRLSVSIPPCANDSGIALGAAISVSVQRGYSLPVLKTASLGRFVNENYIFDSLRPYGLRPVLCETSKIANLLLNRNVVGWFSGRSEIGPRSLGNRSILAVPDSERIRDWVNVHKGRETWRPLAPSVDESSFEKYLSGFESQYMLKTAYVRNKRFLGVTHVDGTTRAQVVRGNENEPYKRLLSEIQNEGDCPGAVLCTSFNYAGEPMVYTIADAVKSARRIGLKYLAGDNWICELS